MLAFRIALRYLFSKKSHNAVNVISAISLAGVAVASMAIMIVLSVFNGFTELSASHLSKIDPDLKVVAARGKTIADGDSAAAVIMTVSGVAAAMPSVEERGLIVAGNNQMPVIFKGVGDNYRDIIAVDSIVIDGIYTEAVDTAGAMQIAVGVANRTGLRPSLLSVADVYVPRREGRINPANPMAAFRGTRLTVTGVTQIDQADIDNDRIIIPLDRARQLLDYDREATAIEVRLAPGASAEEVSQAIAATLGGSVRVLTRSAQQGSAMKMIAIEKWVTFLMLCFILIIASFNIISTLSLLVIEKRDDMKTLRALGAARSQIRSIFRYEGLLITIAGGTAGIILGLLLSLAQQHFGFIKLNGDPTTLTISTYPVAVSGLDVLAVFGAIVVIALLTSSLTTIFTRKI